VLSELINKIAVEFYKFKGIEKSYIHVLCRRIRAFDESISNVNFFNHKNEIRDFVDGEVSHVIVGQNNSSMDAYLAT
jgi:hypothetical protein